jgi:hypothetical protein
MAAGAVTRPSATAADMSVFMSGVLFVCVAADIMRPEAAKTMKTGVKFQ